MLMLMPMLVGAMPQPQAEAQAEIGIRTRQGRAGQGKIRPDEAKQKLKSTREIVVKRKGTESQHENH